MGHTPLLRNHWRQREDGSWDVARARAAVAPDIHLGDRSRRTLNSRTLAVDTPASYGDMAVYR